MPVQGVHDCGIEKAGDFTGCDAAEMCLFDLRMCDVGYWKMNAEDW